MNQYNVASVDLHDVIFM